MKRLWRGIPSIIRWLLVTMLLLIIVGGAAYAYKALTATVEVTVEECLSFIGPSDFQVSLYPGEIITVQVIIDNASSVDIEVDLVAFTDPDPGTKGLSINYPGKITVPALGLETVNIGISASKSAVPGTYTVSIDFDR